MHQAEDMLMEDMPIIPLYHTRTKESRAMLRV